MPIHSTAVIDPSAELDSTVEIGAYAIVEKGARIHAGTRIWPHGYVCEGATIGERCQIHPYAIIGNHPQDLAWKNTPSYTDIGDDTIIREYATIHRGTMPESRTVLGKRCYLMAFAHVAHNCHLGDDVKLGNNTVLAGHVHIGDKTFVSANCGAHQFVRIGELAMIGGGAQIINDVPPFMMMAMPALHGGVMGTNVIGLRRAGVSAAERTEIRNAYKLLYRSDLGFREAIEQVAGQMRSESGKRLVEFLRAPSKRGFARFRSGAAGNGNAEAADEANS